MIASRAAAVKRWAWEERGAGRIARCFAETKGCLSVFRGDAKHLATRRTLGQVRDLARRHTWGQWVGPNGLCYDGRGFFGQGSSRCRMK